MMETPRSAMYQCLAEVLADPPDWLSLPARDWPLFEAALALSRESRAARQAVEAMLEIDAEPGSVRRSRYARVFQDPARVGLGLYESGALDGRLLTSVTFTVEQWYRQFGLDIPGAELPDHASLELAFLAFISSQDPENQSKIEDAFLRQHAARWLPGLGRKIAASGDPVYVPVGRLLEGWLVETCVRLEVPGFQETVKPHRHAKMTQRPDLLEAKNCTLCSFCVQACPTEALAIHENEHTTSLFLMVDRCIECGKCTRICPTATLILGQMPANLPSTAEQRYALRTSERVSCKACGAPMVSQAEMAYVSQQLDYPDWLAYCPVCRP